MKLHPDYDDFLHSLLRHKVEFVIVGAYALAFHGHPRATGDIDVWIHPHPENARRLIEALVAFGFGSLDITPEDLLSGKTIQLGYPPVRIDLLTRLDGVTSAEIWEGKISGTLGGFPVFFIGRDVYLKNKRASGRPQDLADLDALGE